METTSPYIGKTLGKGADVMRVLMVDDHVMFLQSMKTLLAVLAPSLAIDTADRPEAALALTGGANYQLMLLDWHLAAGSNGGQLIRQLRDAGCAAQVVVVSGDVSEEVIREAVDLGAAGFIPKRYSSEAMLSALDLVLSGGVFLPSEALLQAGWPRGPGAAQKVVDIEKRFSQLTPRQAEVYRAAVRGLPNKLIARELGIAESTVKTHLSVVYEVLCVKNRTQAAYQASAEGFRVRT